MSAPDMRGTVLTTVYNGAPHVERYCDNILRGLTEAPGLRWLLIDDGSTDGTTDRVCDELYRRGVSSDRINVHRVGRIGRAAALNAAVARVTTPHFYVQDFDDESFGTRYALQADRLDADPSVACVGGGYLHVDLDRGTEELRVSTFDPGA